MPTPLTTLSKALQEAVAARLGEIATLAGVPVITRRRAELQSDIEAALGNLGACIQVLPALPVEVNPNLPGPYCSRLEIRVRAIENPLVASALPDAYELAETILTGLHEADLSAADGLAGANPLQCQARPIEDESDDETLVFTLTFTTSIGLPASPAVNE